jgi:hypothetical protein
MQTYRNAGGFVVVLCDTNGWLTTPWPDHVNIIDTLIDDHYSSLDTVVFEVDLGEYCAKKEVVTVRIINVYRGDRLEARGTQKVKITSVRLTTIARV